MQQSPGNLFPVTLGVMQMCHNAKLEKKKSYLDVTIQ